MRCLRKECGCDEPSDTERPDIDKAVACQPDADVLKARDGLRELVLVEMLLSSNRVTVEKTRCVNVKDRFSETELPNGSVATVSFPLALGCATCC